ncbi:MAG TPA: LacI family DNA-binding transcriptional regulator, partial [Acidimicrobiia bacterium]|nr:LacI family DNA-binding transcriptional regulator [Acidimicrobiia bacterium]
MTDSSEETPTPEPRSVARSSLRDVARLAGVSASTASRVVSGSNHPVSAQARARVLEAARVLDFRPNRLARALATARSHTIGVVVHDAADPYFAQVIRGLEDVLEEHDYALFVASSDLEPATELACIEAFLSHQVDAIVLAASAIDDAKHTADLSQVLDEFIGRGGQVVCLSEQTYPGAAVLIHNDEVAATATTHLIELGHRRIAYLAGPSQLLVNKSRQSGYVMALERAGLEYDPLLVYEGDFTLESGRDATDWLIGSTDATGLVAANDLMGIGLIRGLLERGVRVPESMSVVGIDDIPFTDYAPVPLSSVSIPLTDLGRRGGAMVMRLLAGEEPGPDEVSH